MSPPCELTNFPTRGFPRVSGDEPITLDVQGATVEVFPA